MHPLLVDSLQALDEPDFRNLFHQFLVLQRYDLSPYVHLFGTLPDDDRSRQGKLSLGSEEVFADALVTQFIGVLRGGPRLGGLGALAETFWHAFPDAVGNRGPVECIAARRKLENHYERHFTLPLLQPQLRALAPRRVLDFGCGLNRLALAVQQEALRIGVGVPTVIGVDVHLPQDAVSDPEHGIHLYDIHDRALASVLDAPVDLVIVKYVMHHMSEAEQSTVMSTLAQVLEPQGTLLVLEASVGTDAEDQNSFVRAQDAHAVWPKAAWAEPYHAWSRRFYRCDGHTQRMLVCLEDTFGHVFLPGPRRDGTPMPLPYTYVDRRLACRMAEEAGLVFDAELSAVLGLPPCLKYGPPSSLLAFRRRSN